MSEMPDQPLHLTRHLALRKQLSTIQKSSMIDVLRAAPTGHKIKILLRFLKARLGPGMLSSGEFIQFGFCDPKVSPDHIATFAGKSAQQAFNKIYNDQTWYAVTKHKMLFETLMKGAAQPIPETIAIFDRKGRGAGPPLLKSREELEHFLLDTANHPVFCKPTTGLLSIGSFRIDGLSNKDRLIVNGLHEYPIDEVCDYIQGISKKGYLFQKVLTPHKAFGRIDCDVISSLRFVVLNHEDHAQLHSAVLKIPSSGEVADNFWRNGSMIASVDLESGTIERAVLKTDLGSRPLSRTDEVEEGILDFKLPLFDEAKKVVLEAARFLPAVRVQSWDVALTTMGPVLLEVNFGGDLSVYQLASHKGILNSDYCKLLVKAGFKGKLPAI